jgi:hypothetical protein
MRLPLSSTMRASLASRTTSEAPWGADAAGRGRPVEDPLRDGREEQLVAPRMLRSSFHLRRWTVNWCDRIGRDEVSAAAIVPTG